jgi:antitoxin MazE
MKARIEKHGDILAVQIPDSLAAETGLAENTEVDLTLVEGKLVITPPTRKRETLEELLRRVTPENLHGEWDTGPAMGGEVW